MDRFKLSLPQVASIVVTCVVAAWAVFALTIGGESRMEKRALDTFVQKDQFYEFKERFNRVEQDVSTLKTDMAATKTGVEFLVEKAK